MQDPLQVKICVVAKYNISQKTIFYINLRYEESFVCILDINKFLWMVRIGGSTEKGQHIKENQYYTPSGEFRVDAEGSPTLHNCLMYKMCYYRFGQLYTEGGK